MDTDPDSELLRRYVKEGSGEAFDELVRRHLDVVYGVVLRKVDGDSELAKDVTQDLFRDLARRAGRLVSHPSLVGWLFVGARYYAANCRRAERRRRVREAKAAELEAVDMTHSSSEDHHEDLYPALEDALAKLKDKDRQAIPIGARRWPGW